MGGLLGLLLIFLVVLALLLGMSVGLAFLLHWLLPAVGMEMGLLIAVLAVGQSLLLFARLIATLPAPDGDLGEEAPPIVILDSPLRRPRRKR